MNCRTGSNVRIQPLATLEDAASRKCQLCRCCQRCQIPAASAERNRHCDLETSTAQSQSSPRLRGSTRIPHLHRRLRPPRLPRKDCRYRQISDHPHSESLHPGGSKTINDRLCPIAVRGTEFVSPIDPERVFECNRLITTIPAKAVSFRTCCICPTHVGWPL